MELLEMELMKIAMLATIVHSKLQQEMTSQ